jgi:hypothetical protein
MWLLTNRSDIRVPSSTTKHEFPHYSLFVEKVDHLQIESSNDKTIVIDGYILPRRERYEQLSRYPQLQLVRHLLEEQPEPPTGGLSYQNWFKDFLSEGLRRYDRYTEYFHPITNELEQRVIQTEKDAFAFPDWWRSDAGSNSSRETWIALLRDNRLKS